MEIQEIKQNLSLATVLHYYGLRSDKNNKLNCPFHEDKTPSMQVYYKTQTAYCFSSNCKTHGKSIDVIDFILHKENFTKHEAINKAIEILGHKELNRADRNQLNPMARICTKYCRQRIARICNPCPHSKYLIPKSHFNNGVAFGFYNVAPLPEEFLQKSCANVPRSAKSSF